MTAHWRRFIRPLMWRCKWLELQIKELQSQALKYEREIAEDDERKEFEFGRLMSENVGTKSLPFSSQMRRDRFMKRKKRKRLEETTDIASYMSHHNLFSYYGMKFTNSASCSICLPSTKCLICIFMSFLFFRE